eukprot:COSAG02_NODE_20925_length_809_cov_2.071831_1_plen_45_part_10
MVGMCKHSLLANESDVLVSVLDLFQPANITLPDSPTVSQRRASGL